MNGSWHGGKGSARRQSSSQKLYEEGWERIFGKNKKKDDEKEHLDEKKEDVLQFLTSKSTTTKLKT